MALTPGIGFTGTVDAAQDAVRSKFQGASMPVVWGWGSLAVSVNAGAALTVDIGEGTSWAHGVLTTNDAVVSKSFAAVVLVGATRWDAVVLRRNWSTSAVTFEVVQGVAAAAAPQIIPSGVNNNPGVIHDQVLALVKITQGSTVPVVVPTRLWAGKLFGAPSLQALPPASTNLYMTEVVLESGSRYRCVRDTSGSYVWAQQTNLMKATGNAAAVPSEGWVVPTIGVRAVRDENTGLVTLDLAFRRTGGNLAASTGGGNFSDTPVCQVTSAFRPNRMTPITMQYAGGASYVWYGATARMGVDGVVTLQSGAPGVDLNTRTGTSDISLWATFTFYKET